MNKFSLFYALALLTVVSCNLDYDGSTRVVFEGRVVGPTGAPLKDIPIVLKAYNDDISDYISLDATDSNGRYLMIMPMPEGEGARAAVLVNESSNSGGPDNPMYTQVYHNGLSAKGEHNYYTNLGTDTLQLAQ